MDDGYETARSLPELLDQRPLGRLLRAGSRRIGMWRIGILMSASENDTGYQGLLATFRYELKKLGREEGRNIRMRRREFLGVLSGAAALPLIPFAACAQQTMPVIGLLTGFALEPVAHLIEAFRRGLKETDFVEGQNVVIEYRSADGDYERLPALAADLVHRRVSVIVAIGPPPRRWLQRRPPQRFHSYSRAAAMWLNPVLSSVLTGRVATPLASTCSRRRSKRKNLR
jgi:hypothetical protein